ncbi:restriction endonuclease subunit S [Bacteroides ovatus]|nr:restriction endonuclease subunit S [Bacteroides ovatus]
MIRETKCLDVPHLRFPEFTEEWVNVSLKDVADFQKERISSGLLDESTYISTENILQNFQGVQSAISIPANTNVVAYKKNDILLSNIRPYLKKVWFSDRIGGCSADVFVLRSKTCEPEFLYNVIASDKFINYVMSGAKGVKMPRGDKNQMESFSFSIPAVVEQRKISRLFQLLDERIVTQNKIIEKLQSLIKGLAVALTTKEKANIAISQCLECHSSTLQESEVLSSGLCKVFGANGLVGYKDVPQMNGDAILVIKDGSGVGTVSYAQGKFSVIGTLNYLTVIGNNDLRYLYFALSVFNFQPYKTGMAIPHIYFKDYGKAKIYCPSLAEQKRVANVLDKLESKLFVEQELLASFNQQKLYLLGKMFI